MNAIILLVFIGIYISLVVIFMNNLKNDNYINKVIQNDYYNKEMKTFFYEANLLRKLKISPNKVKFVLYAFRFFTLFFLVSLFVMLDGLALLFIGWVVVLFYTEDAYKKAIMDSGVNNIASINNFINFFVPYISGGNSAEQSLLAYIGYSNDVELKEWYENRNNKSFVVPKHVSQIVDIYDIALYNEEKGINNYLYILNELSKDYSKKQEYFNGFISRIGEIKPTTWSFIIGVPVIILVSYQQTISFWSGIGGYVMSIILTILFAVYRFLILKLQKDTIKAVF